MDSIHLQEAVWFGERKAKESVQEIERRKIYVISVSAPLNVDIFLSHIQQKAVNAIFCQFA